MYAIQTYPLVNTNKYSPGRGCLLFPHASVPGKDEELVEPEGLFQREGRKDHCQRG